MKIEYVYDDEVVMTFECGIGRYPARTAIEQLIESFNAGEIDDMGHLRLVKE